MKLTEQQIRKLSKKFYSECTNNLDNLLMLRNYSHDPDNMWEWIKSNIINPEAEGRFTDEMLDEINKNYPKDEVESCMSCNTWISVENELPNTARNVLVSDSYGQMDTGFFNVGRWRTESPLANNGIIYWMEIPPLPQPPTNK